jgi:hypothetical protein
VTRIVEGGAELDAGLSGALRRAAAEGLIAMPLHARVPELLGRPFGEVGQVYFTSFGSSPQAFVPLDTRMEQPESVARAVQRTERNRRRRSGRPAAT